MTFKHSAFFAVATALARPAEAAPVFLDFQFTASDFTSPAPYDPVSGHFTFAFDNAASFDAATAGLWVVNFTLPATDYPVQFAYQQIDDTLILSGVASRFGCGAGPGNNGFCTFIAHASTAPSMNFFYYGAESTTVVHYAGRISAGPRSAVPEPGSWAMMIGGFGAIGGGMRRRRTVAVRMG